MKFLNDFKNIFAVLGIVSIIFWTCSSESVLNVISDDDDSDDYGKYQVSLYDNSMVILNTETGVLKSYSRNTSSQSTSEWVEGALVSVGGAVIGSGNLTVNH